jgi:protocatechuate 3,4-dioxygenase beta subunit
VRALIRATVLIGHAVITVVAASASQSAQAPAHTEPRGGSARITGTVIASDTGRPVRGASVDLASPSTGGRWTAVSDNDGRFEISGLPAGRGYTLRGRKAGFVAMAPGQSSVGSPVRAFDLSDGQRLDKADIRLLRGGVISGRIVDEHGDPIVEVTVHALRAEYITGGRRLFSRQRAQTNDLGEYRLYGLQPGKYYVTATTGRGLEAYEAPSANTRPAPGGSGFAPTFFPGSAIAAEAQPIGVRAGDEVRGTDFALTGVRLAQVSGTVIDSRGRPVPDSVVMLNAARPDGAVMAGLTFAETSADGRFTLSTVAPGDYRLDVRAKSEFEAMAQSGTVGQPQSPNAREFASAPLRVSGQDVQGLVVTTGRGVVFDGGPPPPGLFGKLRVVTYDVSAGMSMSATMLATGSAVNADGTFEVGGLTGTRVVRVTGLPRPLALKAVRANGVDVTDEGFDATGTSVSDLEVVITARPASLAGTVSDGSGAPCGACAVMVFSADSQRWPSRMNSRVVSQVAKAGAFTFEALPAGDYFAVALDALVDGEWAEPENLARLTSQATRVSLGDGESKTVRLPLPSGPGR